MVLASAFGVLAWSVRERWSPFAPVVISFFALFVGLRRNWNPALLVPVLLDLAAVTSAVGSLASMRCPAVLAGHAAPPQPLCPRSWTRPAFGACTARRRSTTPPSATLPPPLPPDLPAIAILVVTTWPVGGWSASSRRWDCLPRTRTTPTLSWTRCRPPRGPPRPPRPRAPVSRHAAARLADARLSRATECL